MERFSPASLPTREKWSGPLCPLLPGDGGQGRSPHYRRPAFSLPELMIALAILGLGLLIIAAALPVGLTYTRASIDRSTGNAAADYALDTFEQRVRTSRRLFGWNHTIQVATNPGRLDNLFRPRVDHSDNAHQLTDDDLFPFVREYEPLIKVRPFVAKNYNTDVSNTPEQSEDVEEMIRKWVLAQSVLTQYQDTHEVDLVQGPLPLGGLKLSLFDNPGLPVTTRFFPDITSAVRYTVANVPTSWFSPLQITSGDRAKLRDRRYAWAIFYRRVAYDRPDMNPFSPTAGQYSAPDATRNDPLEYEVIAVITRRPSERHTYLRQDFAAQTPPAAFNQPRYMAPGTGGNTGEHRLAPVPWLVTFLAFDGYQGVGPINRIGPNANSLPIAQYFGTDRMADPAAAPPAKLVFKCSQQLDDLLPVGSIFIPATNDDVPGALNQFSYNPPAPTSVTLSGLPRRAAGFVPHAPHSLPIYEVIERPDDTTVVVKNNGLYPWIRDPLPAGAAEWPVWVIPPAAVLEGGVAAFDRQSPVVSVQRRFVHLREID